MQALALLRELSAAVKAGGGRHLVGGALTYADIAVAVPLKLMSPTGPAYNRSSLSSCASVLAGSNLHGRMRPLHRDAIIEIGMELLYRATWSAVRWYQTCCAQSQAWSWEVVGVRKRVDCVNLLCLRCHIP